MKHIEVQDLTFKEAGVGTSMSFTGVDAQNLLNALPQVEGKNLEEATGFIAKGK